MTPDPLDGLDLASALNLQAESLLTQVRRLIDAKRISEVSAPALEAIEVYRKAAAAGAEVTGIARNLVTLSSWMANAGLAAEAVSASQAAIDVLRPFQLPAPDRAGYLSLLAESLLTQVRRLIDAKRISEVSAPALEAIEVYRKAAAAGAEVTEIARNLITLSSWTAEAEAKAESVSAAQSAIDVLRPFQPSAPDRASYLSLLADDLHTLVVRLISAERSREEVRTPALEAIEVYQQAAAAGVEVTAGGRITDVLMTLSSRLARFGLTAEAKAAADASRRLLFEIWSKLISTGEVVAIHAALVPTENGDGEIILFGGDNHYYQDAHDHKFDHSARFNCRHPNQALIPVHSPAFDLFCCGHAFMADGQLMVAGGTEEFPGDAGGIHHKLHFEGHRHSAIYDPASGTFRNLPDMEPEPGNGSNKSGGRWYPTLCTLGNGEVYAFQGHPLGDDSRHGNNTPELYQPGSNRWVLRPAVGDISGDPILYPRLHIVNDGKAFVTSLIFGHGKNVLIDPITSAVQEVSPLPDIEYHLFTYPSVLLPLVPEDGYRPRFLLCGGSRSQFLDLGNAGAGWQVVPRNGATANLSRGNSNATLLPTGDVLLTGGTRPDTSDQGGVMQPEIYHTPLDRTTGIYSNGVGRWETINQPATVVRNYHSTALLMPDGRVWIAGGNSAEQPGKPPTVAQKTIQIYNPPYPDGPRPIITSAPSILGYGDDFIIRSPQAEAISSIVLMRCGSSTHAFNGDQRAIYLKFHRTDGDQLTATAPPNGYVAPPGPYMLFMVDRSGCPCEYARFVKFKPPSEQNRHVVIEAKIEFRDDEDFPEPDEHDSDEQTWQIFLNPDIGRFDETIPYEHRWGGEARIEAKFIVTLMNDGSVKITLSADLFEGTSDNTDDLDGQGSATWIISKDAVQEKQELKITNTDEDEPDTYAWFRLEITNRLHFGNHLTG